MVIALTFNSIDSKSGFEQKGYGFGCDSKSGCVGFGYDFGIDVTKVFCRD